MQGMIQITLNFVLNTQIYPISLITKYTEN